MSLLIDSNVCIAFLNGTDEGVRDRLLSRSPAEVYLCSVVKAELYFGARNSARVDHNLARLQDFFEPFESLEFDDRAAEQYGMLRAQLRRAGTPIGANDMLIAAIALAADMSVATRNCGEFRRVPGLRVESF